MTFVITGGCCNDSSCIPVCPVQCIRPRPGDPDFTTAEQLYIDPATCIDCGACMDECPVDAIHGEWDLPNQLGDHLAINAEYFADNPIEASPPPDRHRRALPAGSEVRVAVVGTGPAGSYAAAELCEIEGVQVSVFDRLPTPFGLVRAGVAPDHDSTKLITQRFASVFRRANVHCYLNVEIGKDLTVEELLDSHHAVIWAAGASDDRRLGVEGEDLDGCVPAREFVAWYNGHPDHAQEQFDFNGETAVVIGNGNVALDVARVLTLPSTALARTDIADHALRALGGSNVGRVVVAGRRGPQHAAYTAGELAALVRTPGIDVAAVPVELSSVALRTDRASSILANLPEAMAQPKGIHLRFGLTPTAIRGQDRVEGVEFVDAEGRTEFVSAALVIKAIGYRGRPVPGLPFDATSGTISNVAGRVVDPATGETRLGLYCSGWIKRGATGVIGTNKHDSAETVEALLHDYEAGRLETPSMSREDWDSALRTRVSDIVDEKSWHRIDQAERAAGKDEGRPRRKIVSVDDLLNASRA
ncbi:FAD-dependent oxidoreductase [Paenarthrobacter sp. YJN-D]|uniref:FAD-dependent oxidoreductase n=1 Tax=unclassified Paenarthrobacter TaxID=2634190 RepID=UPI0018784F7F|nr:FAD-dependent oxidoreductase [Paenarthrobacter sp. YJN-D]QOT24094.1 FAD-dependent oxidoreductase [Paenarthrobacter sp. YJN-D]